MHRRFLTHVAVNEWQLCNSRFEPRSLGLTLIHSMIFFKPLLSGVNILCEIGLVGLPLIVQYLQIPGKDCCTIAKPGVQTAWLLSGSLKGQDKISCTGLDLKVGGPTWSPLCSKRHRKEKDKQELPNVWLKMGRYLQFMSIHSICFGSNLLCLPKVKPKNAIRISCRWSPAMFCKMKSISLTWNHVPQPVHCTKRSCNRNFLLKLHPESQSASVPLANLCWMDTH